MANRGRPLDLDKDAAILAAARELMYRDGPQAVTMDAAAHLAGVSKATVYSRHANRKSLMRAVLQQHAAEMTNHFAVAPNSLDDARGALSLFAGQLLAWVTSDAHARLIRAICAAQAVAPERVQELYLSGPQKTLDGLAHWLQEAADAGLVECAQPQRSAEMMLGMLTGVDIARAMYGLPFSHRGHERDDYVATVVDAFLRLHGVAPAANPVCQTRATEGRAGPQARQKKRGKPQSAGTRQTAKAE